MLYTCQSSPLRPHFLPTEQSAPLFALRMHSPKAPSAPRNSENKTGRGGRDFAGSARVHKDSRRQQPEAFANTICKPQGRLQVQTAAPGPLVFQKLRRQTTNVGSTFEKAKWRTRLQTLFAKFVKHGQVTLLRTSRSLPMSSPCQSMYDDEQEHRSLW